VAFKIKPIVHRDEKGKETMTEALRDHRYIVRSEIVNFIDSIKRPKIRGSKLKE